MRHEGVRGTGLCNAAVRTHQEGNYSMMNNKNILKIKLFTTFASRSALCINVTIIYESLTSCLSPPVSQRDSMTLQGPNKIIMYICVFQIENYGIQHQLSFVSNPFKLPEMFMSFEFMTKLSIHFKRN